MKKFIATFITVLFLASICEAGKVLMNVWDGCEYGIIEKLYNAGKLPNLKSIGGLKHLTTNEDYFGTIIPTCRKRHMLSQTKPQHATMLTGVLADQHGVLDNNEGCYQKIPAKLTLYKKIKDINSNVLTAHLTAKKDMIGEVMFGNVVPIVDRFHSSNRPPSAVALEVKNLIPLWKDQEFLIFMHFGYPDGLGHQYGFNSPQYEDAIIEDDKQLGVIIDTLKANGIYDSVAIYVLSDHGFGCPTAMEHRCAKNTFIVSTDSRVVNGKFMKDVAGYILSNY